MYGLKFVYFVAIFFSLVYYLAYAVWSGNNLAVIVPVPDRYISIEFWRLAVSAADIFTPFFTIYYLYNTLFRTIRVLHLLVVIVSLVLEAVLLLWHVVDVIDCATTLHCIGTGGGPLGLDTAFLVVLVTLITRFVINFIFLIINSYVNSTIKARNFLDWAANPNRQPVYGDTQAYSNLQVYPRNFIGQNLSQREQHPQRRLVTTTTTSNTYDDDSDIELDHRQHQQHAYSNGDSTSRISASAAAVTASVLDFMFTSWIRSMIPIEGFLNNDDEEQEQEGGVHKELSRMV